MVYPHNHSTPAPVNTMATPASCPVCIGPISAPVMPCSQCQSLVCAECCFHCLKKTPAAPTCVTCRAPIVRVLVFTESNQLTAFVESALSPAEQAAAADLRHQLIAAIRSMSSSSSSSSKQKLSSVSHNSVTPSVFVAAFDSARSQSQKEALQCLGAVTDLHTANMKTFRAAKVRFAKMCAETAKFDREIYAGQIRTRVVIEALPRGDTVTFERRGIEDVFGKFVAGITRHVSAYERFVTDIRSTAHRSNMVETGIIVVESTADRKRSPEEHEAATSRRKVPRRSSSSSPSSSSSGEAAAV